MHWRNGRQSPERFSTTSHLDAVVHARHLRTAAHPLHSPDPRGLSSAASVIISCLTVVSCNRVVQPYGRASQPLIIVCRVQAPVHCCEMSVVTSHPSFSVSASVVRIQALILIFN